MDEYKVKSFTFYGTYFELIDNVSIEDKKTLLLSIFDYMFKNIEPQLNGLNRAIFNNLRRPLDISKQQSERRTEEKPKKNRKRTEKKPKTNTSMMLMSMSNVYVIINKNIDSKYITLIETLNKWVTYKKEKNQFYKETGFMSLLTQVKNKVNKFGEEAVVEVINNSMANNYDGIIFNSLKETKKAPEWFDKTINLKKPTEEEQAEFDELLKDYKEE